MQQAQLMLNFDKGAAETYHTCREYIAARVHQLGKPQKSVAADMDYSPSDLSRKLSQAPDDSRRFTLDDLEKFVQVTGDIKPILYLVEKYLAKADETALLYQIEQLQKQLADTKRKVRK